MTAPYELSAKLDKATWEVIRHLLAVRSSGRCEVRTEECLQIARGYLTLPRHLASVHHRLPRGMGGTSDPEINRMSNLVLCCGTGTTGCHGYITRNPEWALDRGWSVRRGTDPAEVPITLPSWRKVRLADCAPAYLAPPVEEGHGWIGAA